MLAIRARRAFDGDRFLDGGATVFVAADRIAGVEPFGHPVPHDCDVQECAGTLLPGLVDVHTHLVTDDSIGALDKVAGRSADELDAVIGRALAAQLAAGVTTVRDLGDRAFAVLTHLDDRSRGPEPTVVASGPPITSVGGHCHFLGGETAGVEQIVRAVRERADRGVDLVKVMASGGMNTDGTDLMGTQFTDAELRLLVEEAHRAGLPVTAHAHALTAVEQALAAGVDGLEHCTCLTADGFGQASDDLLARLARSGVAVCPTLGFDGELTTPPPPQMQRLLDREGWTMDAMRQVRADFCGRMHAAGVRIVSGVDSGIAPPKRHGSLAFAVTELGLGGLTAADTLATATSLAAEACGLGDRKGRLRAGYDADLLVAAGDLSADLECLRLPERVYLAGRPVDGARPAQPFT